MATKERLRQLEFGILRPEEPGSERNQELVEALGPHLVATADNISARLGYRRDDEQS